MNIILCAALFLLPFWGLLHTMYGGIAPYRDSGDLIVSGYTLGIAHPPGYSLYVIISKIFTILIPWGNTAYKIQLFSAVSAALCGLMVLLILLELDKIKPSPTNNLNTGFYFAAACAGIFSTACWSLSQVAEMYTQQAFLSLSIIWLVVKFFAAPAGILRFDYLAAAGLIFGLSLSMHQTVVLILPALAVIGYQKIAKGGIPLYDKMLLKQFLAVILLTAAGIFLFAYFPIRSMQQPVADWGDPESLRNFFRLITRADYGIFKLHPGQSSLISSFSGAVGQLYFFAGNISKQIHPIYFVFAVIGLITAAVRLNLGWFFGALFIFTGPIFSLAANLPPAERTSYPILETNLVLPNFLMAILAGVAISAFYKLNRIFKFFLFAAAVSALALQVYAGYTASNKRNNYLAYDYGKNIYRSMEKGGCLFDPDDSTTFITQYLTIAHNQRPDIRKIVFFRTLWGARRLIKLYPEIMPKDTPANSSVFLESFFKKNIAAVPIYADLPGKVPQEFDYFPIGSLYKMRERKQNLSGRREYEAFIWNLYSLRFDINEKSQKDFFNQQILSYYMSGYNNLGLKYAAARDYKRALEAYNNALSFDIGFYETYNNIGILHYYNKEYPKALKYFGFGLNYKPNEPTLHYNIGLLYREVGDYSKALEYLSSAGTAQSLNEAGYIFLNQNELDIAENYFKDAVKKDPNFNLAYYNLAVVYEKKMRYPVAEKYYRIYMGMATDKAEKNQINSKLAELKRKM